MRQRSGDDAVCNAGIYFERQMGAVLLGGCDWKHGNDLSDEAARLQCMKVRRALVGPIPGFERAMVRHRA